MTWDFQFLILLNTNSLNSFMFFYHLNSFLKKYSKIPLNSEKKQIYAMTWDIQFLSIP